MRGYTDLAVTNSSAYLMDTDTAKSLSSADVVHVSPLGVELADPGFLGEIANAAQAVLLMEGRAGTTNKPLVLEVRNNHPAISAPFSPLRAAIS